MEKVFIIGFAFISLLGTFLHFVYDITNHNKVAAIFGAVNESTWEHIKLALTPFFIWCLFDGYIYGANPNYFFAKFVGATAIIAILPLIFYGYTSIFKKTILFVDITSFFVTIGLSQYFTYMILNSNKIPYYINYISLSMLFIIFGSYMILTLMPYKMFLFKDPITKKYGLSGHSETLKKKSK